ncbi:MAG: amidophosphoribosyltransferase [Calditrichaceae bacterium]|nr:amidophosphoribosyltransferase [Calditrichaceae bacterium]MBN2708381.1 amidophosphoribosyltransferase [Calditrichaceae bacterium]
MGGFFGVVSKEDCVSDLFYGTDYHSHLGTKRGGLAVKNSKEYIRYIHDITNSPFRTKFETDIRKMHGNKGIGIISDTEDQPILVYSHLGSFAIVTVGFIQNREEILKKLFKKKSVHFSELNDGEVNPTELVASIINQENTIEEGIKKVQEIIEGSCSMLILTEKGIYAVRDKLGRTPVVIGEKEGALSATFETCAFYNLNYAVKKYLGPGECVFLSEEGMEQKIAPGNQMRICSFLWIYYGYPSSSYEDINVEAVRNKCGEYLAKNDKVKADLVAGIPDSGIAHAIGYAHYAKIPYRRPFVKYTPTWPRSFMPQDQESRDLVAKMKLIPVKEIIQGKKIMFCEDSIVRGTQLKDTINRLYDAGALEVHMRPACPPLIFGCKYLNFSRSRSVSELAARRAIKELEGTEIPDPKAYADSKTEQYCSMVEAIRKRLGLTSLKFQDINDMVKAIGLPKEKLCTYCFDREG